MKQETRPDVHMEKQLGWARKLGGAVCGDLQGGSNGVSQTDGVAGMAPAWQLCPLWGRTAGQRSGIPLSPLGKGTA